jgi:D-alanine-D-alanine ligase
MTRVAIAHDDWGLVCPKDAAGMHSELAVIEAVVAVETACRDAGWETCRIVVGSRGSDAGRGWARHLVADLEREQPDVVLNLIESVDGISSLEVAAAWLLELSGVPYTGAPPRALQLALDKSIAKAVLAARGVPVAAGLVMETGDEPLPPRLRWPLIVKPVREDGSNGITQDSVVADEAALRRRVAQVVAEFLQPALVEEYVDGREINVAMLGEGDSLEMLPLAEIDFAGYPEGRRRIVTYDAKWDPGSQEYTGTVSVAAKDMDEGLRKRLAAVALAAHRAIGVRDYARVDIRLDPERGPIVLEVNPNPDISPDAGIARTAARVGMSHSALVQRIVNMAIERGRHASA